MSDAMINALVIVVGQCATCRGQLVRFRFDVGFRLIESDGK